MATYCFQSADGSVIERDAPMTNAPKVGSIIVVRGKRYRRIMLVPVLKELNAMERGEKPSISHQLPTYYGMRAGEETWERHMQAIEKEHGIPPGPIARKFLTQQGLAPSNKLIERNSKAKAERAGVLDRYDKKGRPIARNKREVGRVLDTAKRVGDVLDWS